MTAERRNNNETMIGGARGTARPPARHWQQFFSLSGQVEAKKAAIMLNA